MAEYRRTPMLVRRNKVAEALEWLKINHSDYRDLQISQENLESYEPEGIPVLPEYQETNAAEGNTLATATSQFDPETEIGTDTGPCPFTVQGLTGPEYENMSFRALKLRALRHMEEGGYALGMGHGARPLSIYDDTQVYPQMFPWLFPYGLGGIGQKRLKGKLSETEHKKWLLMYHDKRFQRDLYFPMVAFNHEQIKATTTNSFLLTGKKRFDSVAEGLSRLNPETLNNLAERMKQGERITNPTDEEKECFQLLDSLEHVGGGVKGSLTNKKHMRNEIWSLIIAKGVPSWFVTLSPADNKHPICIYLAGNGGKFEPEVLPAAVRDSVTMSNPVAAARFFHHMVQAFIKHVLGWEKGKGIYGQTSAYYGTVEQQGRLTLHLHMLIWIEGALSPQAIRDKLVNKESEFQKSLIRYLESCHKGEFLTGTLDEVKARVPYNTITRQGIHAVCEDGNDDIPPGYVDPTLTLPQAPPDACSKHKTADDPQCEACQAMIKWRRGYEAEVDDLLLRSNLHRCRTSVASKSEDNPTLVTKGCLNKANVCTARFPREIVPESYVDDKGHIFVKKLESMMNTFTPAVTYVLDCNTDVTPLALSGTRLKAIIVYVTDYITKPGLKTYQIFSSAYDVFCRKQETLEEVDGRQWARKLITQIANTLSSKVEIGSLAACMYLLGNPDHYKSHEFVLLWWRSYVQHIRAVWGEIGYGKDNKLSTEYGLVEEEDEKVILGKKNGEVVGHTVVNEYKYRPTAYEDLNVYEWIQSSQKSYRPKNKTYERTKYKRFDTDDPAYASTVVSCDLSRQDRVLPNVVGSALPRSDVGDREYYCQTMLTLFKPWRSGLELKEAGKSWSEAFEAEEFSESTRTLMANMDLKYKCLDARDDFHSQLKQRTKEALRAMGLSGTGSPEGEEEGDAQDDYVAFLQDQQIEAERHGPKHELMLQRMAEIDGIMVRTGWLKEGHASDHAGGMQKERFWPEESLSAAGWKNCVQRAKEARQELKRKHFVATIPGRTMSCVEANWVPDQVKVVDVEYLSRGFKAQREQDMDVLRGVVEDFNLNEAQERAFRIIGQHSIESGGEQLKMYLGGMGGTGKSQVIKALIAMFERRQEAHRFTVLAPTGTAAALLNGSTYHAALGFRGTGKGDSIFVVKSVAAISDLRDKLAGIDYIFLDEVSMISCRDLYLISAQLAVIKGIHDQPFGGLNVILAGDFTQLPPTAGCALYAAVSINATYGRMSGRDQENIIGKMIWHQFVTVVILRENMRQRTQSQDDERLRRALVNMRYGACTKEDISFLKTREIGNLKGRVDLCDPRYRDVSIITAWNAQKDRINELGVKRFAKDRGVEIHSFYSVDTLGTGTEDGKKVRNKGKRRALTEKEQEWLWESYPCTSEHTPGRLDLCIGLPVMIRYNDATELCITKGQEAVVVGWDAGVNGKGKEVLETLFVELVNPPQRVQIGSLPTNVVPIPKTSTKIVARLPYGDIHLSIKRTQVVVLPNFAMTDYASQGKTRDINIVDMAHCRNSQSYYTCLSRSASAAGTVLLQPINTLKITEGISGYLPQEFRELEILDEITRLVFNGDLERTVMSGMRNPTIRKYQLRQKDEKISDKQWHEALKWPKSKNLELGEEGTLLWKGVRGTQQGSYVLGTDNAKKRSGGDLTDEARGRRQSSRERGIVWDNKDDSCAYDALFTWVINMADEDAQLFEGGQRTSPYMSMLLSGLASFDEGTVGALEHVRDAVRERMREECDLPRGKVYVKLADVAVLLFGREEWGYVEWQCRNAACRRMHRVRMGTVMDVYVRNNSKVKTMGDYLTGQGMTCGRCGSRLSGWTKMESVPDLLAIETTGKAIRMDPNVVIDGLTMTLSGVVYGDGHHFVMRFIDRGGGVWYHDGMKTGAKLMREKGQVDLSECKKRKKYKPSMYLYTRDNRS